MKSKFLMLIACGLSFWLGAANAVPLTAYYQPTPYPATVSKGVHVLDGWINSVYYNKTFQKTDQLQVGGWGDQYNTYLQFDLEGLPANVSDATLMLESVPRGDTSTLTNFKLSVPLSSWAPAFPATAMTWSTQPARQDLTTYSPGQTNAWWSLSITDRYNGWMSGKYPNYGIVLTPLSNNNNFDVWRSSRNSSDGYRPILKLTFTPPVTVPNFKLPLPGGLSWLVTTEAGGYDCRGSFDPNHSGAHYFSIDFVWQTQQNRYKSTDRVPVIAAADGQVIQATFTSDNGNFVVLQHGSPGGFTTRYLHLDSLSVANGRTVKQGDLLGYMGNTGISTGKHLHFGIEYAHDGSSWTNVRYAVVDGWLMKSIQSECSVTTSGAPNTWIRYYASSNRTY